MSINSGGSVYPDIDGREMQEEMGDVITHRGLGHTYVFAQIWPSWSFAVDGLGLAGVSTYVEWKSGIAREEFKATPIGASLVGLAEIKKRIKEEKHNLMPPPLVFIQGSPSFISSTLELVGDVPCHSICAIANSPTKPVAPSAVSHISDLHWRQVSHRSLRGVTSGSWMFGSSINLSPYGGIEHATVKRTLKQVLRCTEHGSKRDIGQTSHRGSKIYTQSDRAPFGQKRFVVETPSVFASGENPLILRDATIVELMDIYDVECASQHALMKFWASENVEQSREFTQQAPVKVLFAAASRVLGILNPFRLPSSGDKDDCNDDNDGIAVPDIHLQSELSPSVGQGTSVGATAGSAAHPTREGSSDGVTVGPQSDTDGPIATPTASPPDSRPNTTHNFGMEPDLQVSEAHIKAAKNDDAEVNVENWDEWTVNSYVPNGPLQKPLVCIPGTLNDDTRRLFSALRKGMLYAYKRRLLRGFLGYINKEHDNNRRVPLDVSYRIRDDTAVGNNEVSRGEIKWKTVSTTIQVSPWTQSSLTNRGSKRKFNRGRRSELSRDLERGADCLERAGHSTFWEWKDGSSIFFWRWPSRYKRALRDGTKLFICGDLPSYKESLNVPSDPQVRQQLHEKLQVPRRKRYICEGHTRSRTGYFPVPKGENDIRIVYDATKCGLNQALWAPNFYLPTIDALLRNADEHTYYGDIDLGEMFLNYALDEALRPYAGVEVSALDPDIIRGEMKARIERWERTLMGLRSSPYVCTQAFSWSEEIIRGDRLAKNNPLRWDKVVLNLPGDKAYDPTLPWVYRWNEETQSIAGYFGTYVDDIRTQNHSESACRETTRRVAGGVGYLGQQDAPRKRRPPTKRPGAWSGAICFSVEGEGLYVTCSQEKWDKGKALVDGLYQDVVVKGAKELDRSRLEKGVGFLVHLSRTFPALFPFFKGIYLTMESWREGRDAEGWKFSRKAWWNLMAGALDHDDDADDLNGKTFEEEKREFLKKNQGPRPENVKVVNRLTRDLSSLKRLFDHDTPPKRLVRGKKVQEALYGFGDASGGGFGSSWKKNNDTRTRMRIGTWGSDMDDSSSNHRELRNLVDTLKRMEKEDTLAGTEAFIFTDNSTAENAFFKGTSASPRLFDLIVELRELEMRARCKVHLIHVAGTRMIEQGSDGLSRGNFTEGSMKGKDILEFVPINRSAIDRSPAVKEWLKTWIKDDLEFLDPEGWFERGHDMTRDGDRNSEGHWIPSYKSGYFVWTPPPAAAEIAVEELRKARHKRQDSTHLFIVPRLMKPYWYKHLCKVADIILTLPVGHSAWPTDMHEPLTIGICFPYLTHRPWELKRAPKLLELGRKLHGVWRENIGTERPVLRELWGLPRKLDRLSPIVASKLLQGVPEGKVSHRSTGKRRRNQMEEKEGRESFSGRKRR